MDDPDGPRGDGADAARERDERRRAERLLEAQAGAAELFAAVEAEGVIRPGVRESQASDEIAALAADRLGVRRHWHKRIVRSGPNTLLTYRADPPDRVIGADDIAFGDFGPIFDRWEADFGRTWVLGSDPVKLRLRDDLPAVFAAGRSYFDGRPDVTGEQLYRHVAAEATSRGWELGNHHCGHLVGEFPHEDFDGDRPASHLMEASTEPMRRPDPSGLVAHWILEVHLVDRERGFGGFYEELLTLP
jgi:Xaa-Pro aminopeptidase